MGGYGLLTARFNGWTLFLRSESCPERSGISSQKREVERVEVLLSR